MNTRIFTVVLTIATSLLTIGYAWADADGMMKMCVTCHGEDGRGGESDTPIIAGIPDVILEDALYAYADGDRDCGVKPMMCKVSTRLTEEQVGELAARYAAMPFVPAGEEFDSVLAEKGKAIHDSDCAICHGADDPGDAQASILHGQRMEYLRSALQQYAAAKRKQLPAMEKKTSQLSGEDIEALINYYASYRER